MEVLYLHTVIVAKCQHAISGYGEKEIKHIGVGVVGHTNTSVVHIREQKFSYPNRELFCSGKTSQGNFDTIFVTNFTPGTDFLKHVWWSRVV